MANAWTDGARFARARKHDGGAFPFADAVAPHVLILVRNDTAAYLGPRSVVKVGDWIVSPVTYPIEAAARPVFGASTPDATTNLFAILIDGVPAGAFGRAVIAGVTTADIEVNSVSHTYATPKSGSSSVLASASSGPARIIDWESGGSTRRAFVLLEGTVGAAGSLTSSQTSENTSYTILADDTWENAGFTTLSLPSAGTYLIHYLVLFIAECTVSNGKILARLYDTTNAAQVENSVVEASAFAGAGANYATASAVFQYTVAAGATLRTEARREAGPTWGSALVQYPTASGAGGNLSLGYVKIA